MKTIYILFSGLFNFIFGGLFFFVALSWMMTFMYVAESFGWIIDPTLDEGLFVVFLILSIFLSAIYLPALIFVNKNLWTKLQMKKLNFITFIFIFFILGVLLVLYKRI
ncbi:hypothetical protein Gferi_14110 [Geosporobacter ferrireducens]|uniref:Uncharacterized protein n=1 Tax=Geosporobacter ferrireducens TaxID=1424294 RepID=A0A1D8GI71_9FIRM|nr:hypothetical protein Gferi_14110 [Geosporobacter ferrireducens]